MTRSHTVLPYVAIILLTSCSGHADRPTAQPKPIDPAIYRTTVPAGPSLDETRSFIRKLCSDGSVDMYYPVEEVSLSRTGTVTFLVKDGRKSKEITFNIRSVHVTDSEKEGHFRFKCIIGDCVREIGFVSGKIYDKDPQLDIGMDNPSDTSRLEKAFYRYEEFFTKDADALF